jgi:pimeloyl-ACP methyl ester carboxylesterase
VAPPGIWYEVAGPPDGPAIALVHGSMDRSAGLLRLSRRLDRDHRVLRYDRRGYGRSVPHPGPFGVADQVADLAALLAAVFARRPAVVFGHSLGGDVAMAVAAAHPDLVAGLVVYEPPLSWLPWWPTTTAGSQALAGAADPADAAEQFMRRLVGDHRWERLPPGTRAARRREGAAMVDELADLRARPPFDAAALDVAVVALRGEHGAEHHRRGVEHLARAVPRCEVVVVDGAKHFGPNTHADAVAAVVAAMVSRLG